MELVLYPDPVLSAGTKPVSSLEGLRELTRRMFEVMYRSRGIGLAAPQVGLNLRLVVANLACDPKQAEREEVYVNPEILERRGEMREEEACLSLPGLSAELVRAAEVKVRYLDLDGTEVVRTATGLQARLFQHEIDHLDGILIADRMTPADRAKWAAHLRGLEEEYHQRKGRSGSPVGR